MAMPPALVENGDFEQGLTGWTVVSGTAFVGQPVDASTINASDVEIDGRPLVPLGGDYWHTPYPIGQNGEFLIRVIAGSGVLESSPFIVRDPFLAFRLGGSMGLVQLGADEKGAIVQLRADLDAPSGFASLVGMAEPSGLEPTNRGASVGGFSLDSAYPRGLLMDLDPPWFDRAPIDAQPSTASSSRHGDIPRITSQACATSGRRRGRTSGHTSRAKRSGCCWAGCPATTPRGSGSRPRPRRDETEAVSAELLPMAGANLGDPIDYGAYLMGQLTGHWLVRRDSARYEPSDGGRLPDFNLDSDRGYAYQCWDYTRHAASKPGAGPLSLDTARPDQWQCAPQLETMLTSLGGKTDQQMADEIFAMYGYQEPLTVPQRCDAKTSN